MSKEPPKIAEWVNADQENIAFRQAVHVILTAISQNPHLKDTMIMKGGILLALAYESNRYTRDIDFSTSKPVDQFDLGRFRKELETSLTYSVERLGYGMDCRIQKCERQPPRDDATFSTIEMTIGYALKSDQKSHRRLLAGQAIKVVGVDYSLNEPLGQIDTLELDNDNNIRVYDLVELVAEKFRALLQQERRNRVRRQDIFDLNFILETHPEINSHDKKQKVLDRLKEKSSARDLSVTSGSMTNPSIRARAQAEYPQLANEIEGALPPFDDIYNAVESYYRSLPWKDEPDGA